MKYLILFLSYVGQITQLLGEILFYIIKGKINFKLTIEQMENVGVNSLSIVVLTTGFTGMVIALQTAQEMVKFGGGSLVGGMVAIAMARELAPVLCGVTVAGRAGSAIAAEVGSMKVTEQIDAMQVMSVSPIYYLAVPRFLSSLIMMPLLTTIATVVGISGGYFVAVHFAEVNPIAYYQSAISFLKLQEVICGLIKSSVFGIIISIVATHQGLTTEGGARGVGKATTNSVVLSIVLIFIANYIMSMLMFRGLGR